MRCPVCKSNRTRIFLQRFRVPVHQNLLCISAESARNVKRGELSLAVCEKCSFIFNQDFDKDLLSYGENYDNTQDCSSAFQNYVKNLIKHLVDDSGITNKAVIEIGCGKGSFLKSLCALGGNSGIGFDPSYLGPSTLMGGKVRFARRFYDSSCESISADIAICRHVIEHVHEPVEFLKSIRKALVRSNHGGVFFETPCVEWIFQNETFWDFFYEHCSYFTRRSLSVAFENVGFSIENIQRVFGNQYFWLEAVLKGRHRYIYEGVSDQFLDITKQFANREKQLIQYWRSRIERSQGLGKLAVWGAGAKGVTFCNLVDPRCEWIDCVVDLNPNKQGRFIPGTGHPIVSYQELSKRNVNTAILMNPNYRQENQQLIWEAGIEVNLIEQEKDETNY